MDLILYTLLILEVEEDKVARQKAINLRETKLVGRVGVDKSDRIRFGRLKAARRVKTRDGLHQPTTWANRRFAFQVSA